MEKISHFNFDLLLDVVKEKTAKHYNMIAPKLMEAYDILSGKNDKTFIPAIFDIEKDFENHLGTNELWSDDNNIMAGVLPEHKLKHGIKGMFLYNGKVQWIILFLSEPIEIKSHKYTKGVLVYQSFNNIDLNCIEKSWGLKNTEQWLTELDLARESFTDITKYSQKIGTHTVCKRPTVKRIIEDINNLEFKHYGPVFSTSYYNYSLDMAHIDALFHSMIVLCFRLKVEGVEL